MHSPIRHLLLSSVLYLPLCFFLWFLLSAVLVYPVGILLNWIMTSWQPDLFKGIVQSGYLLNIETLIFLESNYNFQENKLAVLDIVVNPMIYGYGLAVFSGLTLSTPNIKVFQKVKQIVIAYVVFVFIQLFGVFWQAMKKLLFSAGPEAQQAILNTGINANIVAAFYQISYLILPAVIPVILWVALNRLYLNDLVGLYKKAQKL